MSNEILKASAPLIYKSLNTPYKTHAQRILSKTLYGDNKHGMNKIIKDVLNDRKYFELLKIAEDNYKKFLDDSGISSNDILSVRERITDEMDTITDDIMKLVFGILSLLCFLVPLSALVFFDLSDHQTQAIKDIMPIAVGIAMIPLQWLFGSSRGSDKKNKIIGKNIQKQHDEEN